MARRILRDDPWARIQDLLPGKASDCGVTARDNRRFQEAVLWIERTRAPWRDRPPELGNWQTTFTRFSRRVQHQDPRPRRCARQPHRFHAHRRRTRRPHPGRPGDGEQMREQRQVKRTSSRYRSSASLSVVLSASTLEAATPASLPCSTRRAQA